jgi:hypothetical protein
VHWCALLHRKCRGRPRKTGPDLQVSCSGGGARTHDLRINGSQKSVRDVRLTVSARGFRGVRLSGRPASVWWCAFCAMKCASLGQNSEDRPSSPTEGSAPLGATKTASTSPPTAAPASTKSSSPPSPQRQNSDHPPGRQLAGNSNQRRHHLHRNRLRRTRTHAGTETHRTPGGS